MNVANTTISNWENGISEPDKASLIKLSNIFKCSVDYLLGLTNKTKKQEVESNDEEVLKEIEELGGAYLSWAKNAKENKIPIKDIKLALEIIKKMKNED